MATDTDAKLIASILAKHPSAPQLPADDVQVRTVGRSGERALIEGSKFVEAVWQAAGGRVSDQSEVIDFGAGWGRMAFFASRRLRHGGLTCIDPTPEWLSHAAKQLPQAACVISNPFPPIGLKDARFDLIYSYSVFSHLSPVAADAWMSEFNRILKPGGVLAITTRARDHIAGGALHRNIKRDTPQQTIDKETPGLLAKYDRGEFVFLPSVNRTGLTGDFYGEAAIPVICAKQRWESLFKFESILSGYGAVQSVLVFSKPTSQRL